MMGFASAPPSCQLTAVIARPNEIDPLDCAEANRVFQNRCAVRSCEVAIIGLGLMGSAALRALAERGVDVLGFDPLNVGDARGSSHGSCRIYRRFNFESDAYTELSERAFEGWRSLEAST